MKTHKLKFSFLIVILMSSMGCTSTATRNEVVDSDNINNRLVIYEDGRMKLNSRFVNSKDVVIYADGRGGERAAIKVRVPKHSDFYRDSIIVVRF